jgi:hypothetical protein
MVVAYGDVSDRHILLSDQRLNGGNCSVFFSHWVW